MAVLMVLCCAVLIQCWIIRRFGVSLSDADDELRRQWDVERRDIVE